MISEKNYFERLGNILLGFLFVCYGASLAWIVLVPLLDEDTPLKSMVPSPAGAITAGVFGVSALALSLFALWLLIRCEVVKERLGRSELGRLIDRLGPLGQFYDESLLNITYISEDSGLESVDTVPRWSQTLRPVSSTAGLRIRTVIHAVIRMSDQYTHAVKSTLKLKTVGSSGAGIKKKKKKVEKKTEPDIESEPTETLGNVDTKRPNSASSQPTTKTKAELKFQEMQEKRQTERILKKAEKTHKQRVEEFNKHLDSLSEHYDIPKVSWTK